MALPVVARCERCGREFVDIGKNSKMIDAYPTPANRPWRDRDSKPCGGRIVFVYSDTVAARGGPGHRDGG
jgi:hypothetical protein